MCRFYALRSTRPTRVACDLMAAPNALVRQSHCDAKGECHADGWGLAHYEAGRPQRVRGAGPAFDDEAFRAAADEIVAETVLAHVRNASVGDRTLDNSHPFTLGRWVFAHNGTVPQFDRLLGELTAETHPSLLALRRGSTDSEAVFAWIMSRLADAGIDTSGRGEVDIEKLRQSFARAAAELWARCEALEPGEAKLNFVLTDGRALVATRINHSLHWSADDLSNRCSSCGDSHATGTAGQRAARLASEPLADAGWKEVPNGSVISIDAEARIEIAPLPAVERAGVASGPH